MSLPLHEVIEHQLLKGYAKRVNEDGTDFVEEVARSRPALNAAKVAWISWAVHNGCLPDDAEALTKTDLIEKYGM
jgi:malate synthase